MNITHRAQIKRATDLMSEAHDLLKLAMEREQAYFDNMSAAMQAADEGTAAQDVLDCFEQALNALAAATEAAARAGQRQTREDGSIRLLERPQRPSRPAWRLLRARLSRF